MIRRLSLLLALSLFAAAPASAQELPGSFRLGTDLNFFTFSRISQDGGGTDKSSVFSLFTQGLGLVGGYTIGERIHIGARLELARFTSHNDGDDSSALEWGLGPFLEVLFTSDGIVRPFGLAGIDIFGQVSDSGFSRDKATFFGFRFAAGAHVFLTDTFSLDPRLELAWRTRVGEDPGEPDPSQFKIGLVVGLSGWIGAGASPSAIGGGPSAAPQEQEVHTSIDLGGEVHVDLDGVRDSEEMRITLARRGTQPVLTNCTQLAWQVDGQAAMMPVSHTSEEVRGGVEERLSGSTASNNAALLGNARVVTLTVCGASFNMTPAQLREFQDFSSRLHRVTAPPAQDAWPPPAY